uniref:Uncharacterized protein n=1 Tax=Rhizophora mucronata TaxID=61149 RepID=A0A2P2J4F4_RHIMU
MQAIFLCLFLCFSVSSYSFHSFALECSGRCYFWDLQLHNTEENCISKEF